MVHEAEVALGGAIELTHADLAEALVELTPHILPQAVPNTHVHFVLLVILSLHRHTHTHTPLGENTLKLPQDSGVAYKYIY